MTEQEEEQKKLLEAKLAAKTRLHQFLEKKLVFINWVLLIMWFTVILLEVLNAVANIDFLMDSELIRVSFIGLLIGIPIMFMAEGIGIYRKWGVSVNLEEAEGIVKGKGKDDKK